MIKKLAIGISCIVCACTAAAFAGCGDRDYEAEFADKVKIVFELEGGKYSGRETDSVSHYYDYSDNLKITPLDEIAEDVVKRDGGFTLDGWYRTKTTDASGKTVYSDKWDFSSDKVTKDGLTLYAKWNSPIIYSFDFIYFENGEEKVAKSCKVDEGNKFGDVWKNDVRSYANYAGHTAIEVYYDKDFTVPFDDSVPHPGGEVSTAVKLYAKYIDGDFTLVSTAAQLRMANSNSIYLLNDIDMDGAKLSFTNFKNKTLLGNGYKIYNFTLDYGNSKGNLTENLEDGKRNALCIALFGNADGATVKDVTFEDVTVTVDTFLSDIKKIYLAPLAVTAKDSKFENVSVKGSWGYTKRTENAFDIASTIVFETAKGVIESDNSTETGCTYEITLAGKVD